MRFKSLSPFLNKTQCFANDVGFKDNLAPRDHDDRDKWLRSFAAYLSVHSAMPAESIFAEFRRHTTVVENSRLAPQIEILLKNIWAVLEDAENSKPSYSSRHTKDQSQGVIHELIEGIRNCSLGMHERCSTIWSRMAGDHSITSYLAQMRQELVVNLVHSRIHVERIAPGQEVHFRSRYIKVANAIGLHLPSPETILGLNAEYEAIAKLIEQYIGFHFTPITIFQYLEQAIFSTLRCEGYKGLLNDGNSYLYDNYSSWHEYLISVLGQKLEMSEFLVCDDDGNVIGIDKNVIRQKLFCVLNANYFFRDFTQIDNIDTLFESLRYEREGLIYFTNYASIDTISQGPMLLIKLERKLQIFTRLNFERVKLKLPKEKQAEAVLILDEMIINFLCKENDLSVTQKLNLLELHSAMYERAESKIAAFSPYKFDLSLMKHLLSDDFFHKNPNLSLHLVFSMQGLKDDEMLEIANTSKVNPIACFLIHAKKHHEVALHLKNLLLMYKPKTVALMLGAINPENETLMMQIVKQGEDCIKMLFELSKMLSIKDKYTLLKHQNRNREKLIDVLKQYSSEWSEKFRNLQPDLELATKIQEFMQRITASTSLWYRLPIYRQHKEKELHSCLATFTQLLEFSELDYEVARQILTQFLLVCKQPRGRGQETTSYSTAMRLLHDNVEFRQVSLLVDMESTSSSIRYSP